VPGWAGHEPHRSGAELAFTWALPTLPYRASTRYLGTWMMRSFFFSRVPINLCPALRVLTGLSVHSDLRRHNIYLATHDNGIADADSSIVLRRRAGIYGVGANGEDGNPFAGPR